MGTTAFVGCYDIEGDTPISGTGKTLSMTGFGYLDSIGGAEIWSNYWTSFSDEIIGFQAMINKIRKERQIIKNYEDASKRQRLVLLVTEMQEILNSCGSSNNQVLFVDSFAHQLRKYGVDLYYDTQRFKNIQIRLRTHTDTILLPFKRHLNKKACYSTQCMEPHLIDVYSLKPEREKPIIRFIASTLGKKYNTYQVVYDKLNIPSKKSIKEDEEE
ncbi:MAG TPA: hypothetical protein DCY00_05320 [Actinobacteria bacterium]|nr:hypothetical protein [Actinomycetota bacterium]